MRKYSIVFPSMDDEDTFIDLMHSCAKEDSFNGECIHDYTVTQRQRELTFEYDIDGDYWLFMMQECEEEGLFLHTFTIRLEE